MTRFTAQSITEMNGNSKMNSICVPLGSIQLKYSRQTDIKIFSPWKNGPCVIYLQPLCVSSMASLLRNSPWSCLISSVLPIFSLRLLSKQTVFSKISTDSACYFCFVLLSTKGYDFSTWCISVLNSTEKKTRPRRAKVLMKRMSILVRSSGHLNPVP